jgi:hypothetical protein
MVHVGLTKKPSNRSLNITSSSPDTLATGMTIGKGGDSDDERTDEEDAAFIAKNITAKVYIDRKRITVPLTVLGSLICAEVVEQLLKKYDPQALAGMLSV